MRNLLAAAMLVTGCAPLLGQASATTSTPAAAPAERLARTMLRNTARVGIAEVLSVPGRARGRRKGRLHNHVPGRRVGLRHDG